MYLALFLAIMYILKSFNYRFTIKKEFFIFCLVPLVSAIVSNLAFILYAPYSSLRGASGITYAMAGVIYGISIKNIIQELQLKESLRAKIRVAPKDNLLYISYLITNIFLIIYFTYCITIFKMEFFNIQPGVNVFVHAISLMLAVIVTLKSYNIESDTKGRKN